MKNCKVILAVVLTLAGLVTAAPAAQAAPRKAVHAVSIAMIRSGGYAGGSSNYAVSGNGTLKVLRLASTPAFRKLRSNYVPKNTCCDRFLYRLEVGYSDGSKKRVKALQGTPGNPKILLSVIHELESTPANVASYFPPVFPFI
ncbi:hypothetical protein AB0M02_46405 [Actinoplanes sp. NPDC051861]|uniref:hypothetical protein n=1 Tax=Actinoplanes sp. NPDC051861 TaxID=3155170 RepID=UPI0034473A16